MIDNPNDDVRSALAIFVKDLDIVYSEAKRLQAPVPLAACALQQFISGASLGLSKQDDSSVVKVYETLTGVSVSESSKESTAKEGDDIGDIWVLPDGRKEKIFEAADEKEHHLMLSNEYTRVLKVTLPAKNTTWAHRHAEDSLYFFLVEGGLNVINHVKVRECKWSSSCFESIRLCANPNMCHLSHLSPLFSIQGNDPVCDCMDFGEVRYGTHKTDKPLVHTITNMNDEAMLCIDAEVIKKPPVTSPFPLVADHHTLIKTRDRCRVYSLLLEPGQSTTVSYNFFYLSVMLKGSQIKVSLGHAISWDKTPAIGDVEWCSPTLNLTITNIGSSIFEQYIAEWR